MALSKINSCSRRTVRQGTNADNVFGQLKNLDALVQYVVTQPGFESYAPNPEPSYQEELDRILGSCGGNCLPALDNRQFEATSPRWLYEVPQTLQPEHGGITRLGELPKLNHVPHKMFANLVLQSSGTTKILFERQFEDLRRRRPDASAQELSAAIIHLRYFTTDLADGLALGDSHLLFDQPWQRSIVQSLAEEIDSIGAVAHCIVEEYEDSGSTLPNPRESIRR